jgi:hypothetical protein
MSSSDIICSKTSSISGSAGDTGMRQDDAGSEPQRGLEHAATGA